MPCRFPIIAQRPQIVYYFRHIYSHVPLHYPGDRGDNVQFDYTALGEAIRVLRREKGLSQEVLSGLAGIARTHLTMIETGTLKPNLDTVCKLAQALDLRPSELFALAEERQLKGE